EKENATWGYRHLNSTVVHAFGYAYKISGETKYRDQGDRLFEAAFNYDPADVRRSTGLAADANGKEYNQGYSCGGRYPAWGPGREGLASPHAERAGPHPGPARSAFPGTVPSAPRPRVRLDFGNRE